MDWRKWIAIGTGVGIEIREHDLDVTITRVRPTGLEVLGSATVVGYDSRPAAEWGAELTSFLRKLGCAHVAASVLLSRRDVIVRQLEMPGVQDDDLASAVGFQLDGLHPFSEDETIHSFARVKGTPYVLIGIARRDLIEGYAALFAEAGIKVAAFTFSAAAFYSAIRIPARVAAGEFIAVHDSPAGMELYGESASNPAYSVIVEIANQRALAQAIAELRLAPESVAAPLAQVLPAPRVYPENHDPGGPEFASHAAAYAASVSGACPWLALPVNLLPEAYRRSSSRMRYVPTAVLGSVLALLVAALLLQAKYSDRRYLNLLEGEIHRLQPVAKRASQIDTRIAQIRARTYALDEFRRRSKQDLDALNELTRLMKPPAWATSLELTRGALRLGGETTAAADLLKILDNSPYFKDTEFTSGISRTTTGEAFQLRANRENAPVQAEPAQAKPETAVVPQIAPKAPTGQVIAIR